MSLAIRIKVGHVILKGEFFETPVAMAIYEILPLSSPFNVWGDEFYFETPVNMSPDETATTRVKIGDIGYWPPENAIAIFFGPTPMSTGPDPVPTSEVNIIGKIHGDPRELVEARSAEEITIERA